MLLDANGLLTMQLSVVLEGRVDVFNVYVDGLYLLGKQQVVLLAVFEITLGCSAVVLDLRIEVLYHLSEVGPQTVDIVVLQFYLFGDAFAERGHISEHLATFLHADVQNLELFLNVLGSLLDLPGQFLDVLGLVLKLEIDSVKDSSFEDFRVVCDHESNLANFVSIIILINLNFMQCIGCL
jgi:hypothetical protein